MNDKINNSFFIGLQEHLRFYWFVYLIIGMICSLFIFIGVAYYIADTQATTENLLVVAHTFVGNTEKCVVEKTDGTRALTTNSGCLYDVGQKVKVKTTQVWTEQPQLVIEGLP